MRSERDVIVKRVRRMRSNASAGKKYSKTCATARNRREVDSLCTPRTRRASKRQSIACDERTPVDSAQCTQWRRRAAAENGRHGDTTIEREVRARPAAALSESENTPRTACDWFVQRHIRAIDLRSQIRTRYGDHRGRLEANLRTEQRDFERGRIDVVADQGVCRFVRDAVERAADRHTARLTSPPPAILNRGEESWTQHGHVPAD
jgi:hypothetical protein